MPDNLIVSIFVLLAIIGSGCIVIDMIKNKDQKYHDAWDE